MPKTRGEYSGNGLLQALGDTDTLALTDHLQWVDLDVADILQSPGLAMRYIYFPVSAVCSVSSVGRGAEKIETALIGNEGLVGLSVCLFVPQPSLRIVVQAGGRSLRIAVADFLRAYDNSASLRKIVLRYSYAFLFQVSQTALINVRMTIQQRLARWLLMCQDRIEGSELLVTHQVLSDVLGVRRSGITVALQILESAKAIKATRGKVRIVDRTKLKHVAGNAYGHSEREYERIMRSE